MAYISTNWVNGKTPINATNLNNMEKGIVEANKKIVASAYGSLASLSLTAKTITQLTLDTWDIRSDTSFAFSGGGIKCPYDGYVLVTGNVYFRENGSEDCRRGVYIKKNGTEVHSQYLNEKSSSAGVIGSGVCLLEVKAGDVITLNARQSVATTCAPSNSGTRLIVAYI